MPVLKPKTNNLIESVKISLASPEQILSWSFGEVTKPETINYKSQKPEKDGLFCEKIFGPSKDYECSCGRYKKIKNKGIVCERCGVEVTESIVRRERFGHIELAAPVSHIWMLKTAPSKISLVLNIRAKELEEIVYFISHVIVEPGLTGLKDKEVLDQKAGKERLLFAIKNILKNETITLTEPQKKEAEEYVELLNEEHENYNFDEIGDFLEEVAGAKFSIGAEAIKQLLEKTNLDAEVRKITKEMRKNTTETPKLVKRLGVLESFRKSGNKPEWMVLTILPVLPPNLRPIIQLDGGRFTSSDINDLYRRALIRNERLKKMIDSYAPRIVINNEKRMLQEAIDAVLDNQRKAKPFLSKDKRPLKSLSESLKGKQGRFRQNLLGKRVDYSARSVIVVGPELKLYQCGIPRNIALTLFKPFVISELIKRGEENKVNIKIAERKIANRGDEVWDILEEVIKSRPVLLNRAPTLHRLGIQAFEPILTKSKAISLHPLVTTAFNADFDGDQMAVHLPLSDTAVAEARALLLGSRNILGLKDGKPIVTPTQDMILGCYYLSRECTPLNKAKDTLIFSDENEAIKYYDQGKVELNEFVLIAARSYKEKPFLEDQKNGYIITTTGKILFNSALPKAMPFINSSDFFSNKLGLNKEDVIVISDKATKGALNVTSKAEANKIVFSRKSGKPFDKKVLTQIIIELFKHFKSETPRSLDNIKNLGFKYSTKSCVTMSVFDLEFSGANEKDEINVAKKTIFADVDSKINIYNKLYNEGLLTNSERKSQVIHEWSVAKDNVQSKIENILQKESVRDNPIFMIIDSGARGNISNFTQLVGMRGLMSNPKGEVMELPIKSSFREGLTISEFFISTHGARKGMADTALKTADSGYLTRRLVDVSQDIVVKEEDCKTKRGFLVNDIVDTKTNSIIISMSQRVIGRFALNNIFDEKDNLLVAKDELMTEKNVETIVDANIKAVNIRSVLTCNTKDGVCRKCYGIHLGNNEIVNIGEAVGIIAAQSIGEPGTQLTMRTFHTGGVAGGSDITQGLPRIKELFDVTSPKGRTAIISKVNGIVKDIHEDDQGIYKVLVEYSRFDIVLQAEITEIDEYVTDFDSKLRVKKGDSVVIGQKITDGSINLDNLLQVGDVTEVQNYILKEVQRVYKLQGIEIADKYIEIILRQMLNRIVILDAGDTHLLPGSHIDLHTFKTINEKILHAKKRPAFAKALILGIKKAPLETESFLSSASFQDTTRILAQAAIASKVDILSGLKENVIVGNLIKAGTGLMSDEEILAKGEEAVKNQY